MKTVLKGKSAALKSVAAAPRSNKDVCAFLQSIVNDTYALYLLTQNYHFNVEGPHFRSLHLLFEEQYNELFAAVDIVAERMKALGADVEPLEADDIFKSSKLANAARRKAGQARAEQMVKDLISCNEDMIALGKEARKAAEDADDLETQDMIISRVTAHQKAVWMLASVIK